MTEKYLFLYGMNIINLLIGAGYFILFLLSLHSLTRAAHIVKPQHVNGYRLLWAVIAITILMILISSIFDISKTLMDNTRIIANNQGWYNNRYSLQVIFITGIFAILLLITVVSEASSSGIFSYNGNVIRWLIVLFAFNLINSVSLHFIDQIMNIRILGFRIERCIEIAVIIFILISYKRHFYDLKIRDQHVSYVNPERFI
ncbi:MAG: hypothetical protein JW927_22595 [Deltaproteobacteria bacterium]|nr:hypothetical protein [Deltaproteobacteria bacterium]